MAPQILEFFPLVEAAKRAAEESDDERLAERLKRVHEHSKLLSPKPASEEDERDITRPGEHYRRYRTVSELPKEAEAFYEIAGRF